MIERIKRSNIEFVEKKKEGKLEITTRQIVKKVVSLKY